MERLGSRLESGWTHREARQGGCSLVLGPSGYNTSMGCRMMYCSTPTSTAEAAWNALTLCFWVVALFEQVLAHAQALACKEPRQQVQRLCRPPSLGLSPNRKDICVPGSRNNNLRDHFSRNLKFEVSCQSEPRSWWHCDRVTQFKPLPSGSRSEFPFWLTSGL